MDVFFTSVCNADEKGDRSRIEHEELPSAMFL